MNSEIKLYKSNVKIMKVETNQSKKEEKYIEVEKVFDNLLENIDTLHKDIIKTYVELGKYTAGAKDIPTSKYVEHKEKILKAIAKAESSERILKQKLIKELHYVNDDFNIDEIVAKSIKSDLLADRKDLIEFLNNEVDGVTAEEDTLSDYVVVTNNAKEVLLLDI